MKTKILAGLLVAAALAIAPGVALARGGGGGGGGSHGGGGFYDRERAAALPALQGTSQSCGEVSTRTRPAPVPRGGGFHGGFAHHDFVSDRSFRFGRGFRHDHDRFLGHPFVFGNPWPGYYDPYYLRAYDDYTAVAVQRALAQLGYYHGPVDGVVGPQTEKAIRWFQSR